VTPLPAAPAVEPPRVEPPDPPIPPRIEVPTRANMPSRPRPPTRRSDVGGSDAIDKGKTLNPFDHERDRTINPFPTATPRRSPGRSRS